MGSSQTFNGNFIFIDDHLNRFWNAAKATGIQLPFNKKELIDIINSVLLENNMIDGVHIRVMVTRGIKKTPSQDTRLTISGPNLVIIPEFKLADPVTLKVRGLSYSHLV